LELISFANRLLLLRFSERNIASTKRTAARFAVPMPAPLAASCTDNLSKKTTDVSASQLLPGTIERNSIQFRPAART
jgi:hypothetical protein